MKITKQQLLCKSGTAINEDAANITTSGAWILDGATGLNGRNIVDKDSDAKWFVTWWDNYLSNNIDKNDSLKNIIKSGIQSIKQDYFNLTGNEDITDLDLPSSTVIVLKWYGNIVEYFSLGDSVLIVQRGKTQNVISDVNLKALDDHVFTSMKRLIKTYDMTLLEAKNELMNLIINNRLMKNKKNGYWILSFEEEAVNNAAYGKIQVDDETKILLATDGFSSISEKYNFIPIDDLVSEVDCKGVNYLYEQIRKVEEKDHLGKIFPRFKKSDDASAVFLNFNGI